MVILSSSLSSIHGPWLGRRDHQKQQSGNTTGKQRWFICITWPIWMAHISEKAKNYGLSFPRFSIYIYTYIYIFLWHGCTRIYDFTKITDTYCRPQKRGICLYLCQIYRDLRAAAVFCPLSSYVLASHMLANGKNGHRFHPVSASLGTEGRRTTADNGHSREARGRRHMSGEPDSKHIPSGYVKIAIENGHL